MAGIFRWKRDLTNRTPFPGLYASSVTGGVVDASPQIFPSSQDTTSFRAGGKLGEPIENPREILSRNETRNRFPFDFGNEFDTKKTELVLSHRNFTLRSPYHNAWYQGPILPAAMPLAGYDTLNGNRYHLPIPSWNDYYGTKALADTRPTKSAAEFTRTLAELVLDLPKIPLQQLLDHPPLNLRQLGRLGGKEYLNVVFGWQPTVSDMLKIFEAVVKTTEIIDQFLLDAGRNVRRSRKFEAEVTEENLGTLSANNSSIAYPLVYSNVGKHADLRRDQNGATTSLRLKSTTITKRTQVSYWFSGAWTYWLDGTSSPIEALRYHARIADKLLGTGFDVDLLWQITPWSWIVDWFVNIGDVIAVNNALANDSLLLRYGYMTRKVTTSVTYSNPGYQFLSRNTGPVHATIRTISTTRRRATPYGFGLNPSDFSPTRWAILAALGMTGGDKQFRWG